MAQPMPLPSRPSAKCPELSCRRLGRQEFLSLYFESQMWADTGSSSAKTSVMVEIS